jgi:hypothetical protein
MKLVLFTLGAVNPFRQDVRATKVPAVGHAPTELLERDWVISLESEGFNRIES